MDPGDTPGQGVELHPPECNVLEKALRKRPAGLHVVLVLLEKGVLRESSFGALPKSFLAGEVPQRVHTPRIGVGYVFMQVRKKVPLTCF